MLLTFFGQGLKFRVVCAFVFVVSVGLVYGSVQERGFAKWVEKQDCQDRPDGARVCYISREHEPDPPGPPDPHTPAPPEGGETDPTGGKTENPVIPITPTGCAPAGTALPSTSGGLLASDGNPLRDVSDMDRWKALMTELVAQGYVTSVKRDAKLEASQGKPVYALNVRNDVGPFQGLDAQTIAFALLNPEISAKPLLNQIAGDLSGGLLAPSARREEGVGGGSEKPEEPEVQTIAPIVYAFVVALEAEETAAAVIWFAYRYGPPLIRALNNLNRSELAILLRNLLTRVNMANVMGTANTASEKLRLRALIHTIGMLLDDIGPSNPLSQNDVGCHGGVSGVSASEGASAPTLVGAEGSGAVSVSLSVNEGSPVFRHLDWLEDFAGVYPKRTVACPSVAVDPVEPGSSVVIDFAKECSHVGRSAFGEPQFSLLSRRDVQNIPVQRRGFLYLEDGLAARGLDETMPGDLFTSEDGGAVSSLGQASLSGSKLTYKTSADDLNGGGDLLVVKVTEPVDPDLGVLFAPSRYFLVRIPVKSRPICKVSDATVGREVKDGVVHVDRGESLRLDPLKICPNRYREIKTVKVVSPVGTKKASVDKEDHVFDFSWDDDKVGDVGEMEISAVDKFGQSTRVSLRVHIDDVVPSCGTTDIDVAHVKGVAGVPVSAVIECPMPHGLLPLTSFGGFSPLGFELQPDASFKGPQVGDPDVGDFTDVKVIHEPTGDDPVARLQVTFVPAKDFVGDTFARVVASNIGSESSRVSPVRVHVKEPLIVCSGSVEALVDVNDPSVKTEFVVSCHGKAGVDLKTPVNVWPVKPGSPGKLFPTLYGKLSRVSSSLEKGESVTRFRYVPDSWVQFIAEKQQESFEVFAEHPDFPDAVSNRVSVIIKPGA